MFKKIILASVAIAALVFVSSASATLIISIDQTGANKAVNVDSARAWNFGITDVGAAYFSANGLAFNSALFDAKIHKDTTAPLVFSLYSGLGGNVNGNTLLTSVSIPASEFDNKYSGGDLFSFVPKTLGMGYYSVTLTTTAPNASTKDYFLKQGVLTLRDDKLNALNSAYWLQDQGVGNATSAFNGTGSLSSGVAMAPEASSVFAMVAIAGLSFGGALVRRVRQQSA